MGSSRRILPSRSSKVATVICLAMMVGVSSRASAQVVNPAEDAWVASALLDELPLAGKGNLPKALSDLEKTATSAILARLACGNPTKFESMADMVFVLRASQAMQLLRNSSQTKTADWLIAHRGVFRLLVRAMENSPDKPRCLAAFGELLGSAESAVLDCPDLAVAFATTVPRKYHRNQPNPSTMVESFKWYADPTTKLAYDPRKLPFEALRFIADSRLSMEDRKFAQRTLGMSPAKLYFSVPYDMDQFTKGAAPKNGAVEYTLDNIQKLGGVCIDQAYFASECAKAIGIPATAVSGRGSSGVGHFWLACVVTDGRNYAWDNQTARYPQHKYYTGNVIDPQTGKEMLDCNLMLSGNAALTLRSEQESSWAVVAAARIVDKAIADGTQADLSVFKKLADAYSKKPGAPAADVFVSRWSVAKNKVDLEMLDYLLSEAIKQQPAMPDAWELIVNLCQTGKIDQAKIGKFFNALINETGKKFPEYSCQIVLQIVPTLKTAAERITTLSRGVTTYAGRPDLQSRLLATIGDEYKSGGDLTNALSYYEQAAKRGVTVIEVSLPAAEKAEAIYRQAKNLQPAAVLYYELMTGCETVEAGGQYLQQSGVYQFGKRLATIYMEMGKTEQAKAVLDRIGQPAGR